MIVCHKNIYHIQELQKSVQNKSIKLNSYILDDKVWLNGKYIKTKQNKKLETKFFGLFQVLYSINKQANKLKLSKK